MVGGHEVMAITVETIEVDVDINSGKATVGLNKLERQTKKTTSTMKGLGKSIVAANIATNLLSKAAAGVVRFFKESSEAASNAEETISKFETVYRDLSITSAATAKQLTDDFDLVTGGAEELLGGVGDILTGFGFTQSKALELAESVATLGLDLASFTNYAGGAKGATDALTKALLGEAESVKALGIVIRQDTPEYKNMVASIMEAEGVTLVQAKALTALQIATEQSQNAIGDYARTADSAANTTKRLNASYESLQISVGALVNESLTPMKEVLNDILGLTNETIDAMIEERKYNVLAAEAWDELTRAEKRNSGGRTAFTEQFITNIKLNERWAGIMEREAEQRRIEAEEAARIEDARLEAIRKRMAAEQEYYQLLNDSRNNERAEEAERLADAQNWIDAQQAIKREAHEESLRLIEAQKRAQLDAAMSMYGTLKGIVQTYYQNEIQAAGDNEEKLQEIREKQFRANQAFGIADTIINTATSIMKVLAQGGIFAIPIAATMAALGAAQIGMIASAKPSYATGTPPGGYVVPPGYEDDSFPVSAASGETVSVSRPGQGSGQMVYNVINIDGYQFGEIITRLTTSGKATVKQRAIVA